MADKKRYLTWSSVFGTSHEKHELQTALLRQLEKDLLINIKNSQPEQILALVEKCVEEAIKTQSLTEILYRVDLNETTAHKCLESADAVSELAKELLKREAQKVLFRWQYSGGEKP